MFEYPKVDFAIITTLPIEAKAVVDRLTDYKIEQIEDENIRTFYVGAVPIKDKGQSYRVVVVLLPSMGEISAAIAVTDTINQWRPRFVILVGIAGGLPRDGLSLGDVVVAEQVVGYEYGKVTDQGIQPRDRVYPTSDLLLDRIRNYWEDDWAKTVGMKRPEAGGHKRPKWFNGPVASGNKVVASEAFRSALIERWPKLMAIEMEAEGFYAAMNSHPNISGALVVRGISDMADRKKSDQWQEYAANSAAAFLIGFLSSGPFAPFNPGAIIPQIIDRGVISEYQILLETYKKQLNRLSIEMERLEETQNQCRMFETLYVKHFSKYLLERKDLDIEADRLSQSLQNLQLISQNQIYYIEISGPAKRMEGNAPFDPKSSNTLHYVTNKYKFTTYHNELFVSVLLPEPFHISKYSFPEEILNVTIRNYTILLLETDKAQYMHDLIFRPFQKEEVTKLMEFSNRRNEYAQERDHINKINATLVTEPRINKDQIKEMKTIYKEIMKQTHPDVYGGQYPHEWSKEKVEEYERIVRDSNEAFHNYDFEVLRQVYERIKGKDGFQKEMESKQEIDRIICLKEKIEWYDERIKAIQQKINEIRKSAVYGYRYLLQDEEAMQAAEQKFKTDHEQRRSEVITQKIKFDQAYEAYLRQVRNG